MNDTIWKMCFAEVAAAALYLARHGFLVHPTMAKFIRTKANSYRFLELNMGREQNGGTP